MKMVVINEIPVDMDSLSTDDVRRLKDYFREKEQIKFIDRLKKLFSKTKEVRIQPPKDVCYCGHNGGLIFCDTVIETMGSNDKYYNFIKGKHICICPNCGVLKIK